MRGGQQVAQGGKIPGAVVQREQRHIERIQRIEVEGAVERGARKQDMKIAIQDKHRLANRVHDDLREYARVFDLLEELLHDDLFRKRADPTLIDSR